MGEVAVALVGVALGISAVVAFWRYRPAARAARRQRNRDEHVAMMLARLHAEAEHLAKARGIDYADAVDYLRRGLMDTVRAEAERRGQS